MRKLHSPMNKAVNTKLVSVPLEFMRKGIRPTEIKVFMAIASQCQNPSKSVSISLWTIGEIMGKTEINAITPAFLALAELGLIKREREHTNDSFTYTILV